jgi:hypothetical protein
MKKQTNPKVKRFIESLNRCFLAGDVELNIKLKIAHRNAETLTILDESSGEKFVVQISHVGKNNP